MLVLASCEHIPTAQQKRNGPTSYPLFFKMFQIEDLKKESLNETVFRYVKLTNHLRSDAYRSFSDLNKLVENIH